MSFRPDHPQYGADYDPFLATSIRQAITWSHGSLFKTQKATFPGNLGHNSSVCSLYGVMAQIFDGHYPLSKGTIHLGKGLHIKTPKKEKNCERAIRSTGKGANRNPTSGSRGKARRSDISNHRYLFWRMLGSVVLARCHLTIERSSRRGQCSILQLEHVFSLSTLLLIS